MLEKGFKSKNNVKFDEGLKWEGARVSMRGAGIGEMSFSSKFPVNFVRKVTIRYKTEFSLDFKRKIVVLYKKN